MITWIQYYHQESTKTWDNYGFNTFHLAQLPVLTLSICKMSLIRSYKNVRPGRQVSARSERNCIPKLSMKLLGRSLLIVRNEDSYWWGFVMKSKWPSKHIRLCTRAQLPTECERHYRLSRAKLKCWSKFRTLKTNALSLKKRSKTRNGRLRECYKTNKAERKRQGSSTRTN